MRNKEKRITLLLMGTLSVIIIIYLVVVVRKFWGFKEEPVRKDPVIFSGNHEPDPGEKVIDSNGSIIKVPIDEGDGKDRNISAKKINIYILDSKNKNTVPIAGVVGTSDFTTKAVADEVILALGEKVAGAKVGEVTEEGDGVIIDLLAESAKTPFGEVSAKMEELILNCISYSILDNFPEYGKIYFTVNGEAYNSNKIKISKNKPFINK